MANYLLFEFQGTRYALDADAVQTTFWLPDLSPVEGLPPYFIGLVNLHGQVIPIIDLGLRFGHPPRPCRVDQSVVLLQQGDLRIGLVADQVLDLVVLPTAALGPYIQMDGSASAHGVYVIAGTIKWESAVLIVLDAEALMQPVLQGDDEVGCLVGAMVEAGTGTSRFGELTPMELDKLWRRTQKLAQPPEQAREASDWYATVMIGDLRYAIQLELIAEFTHLGTCTPIPCCPPHILGCMNLRGTILTLVDLAPLLHGQPWRDYRDVVVLRLGEYLMGLAVHQVEDIRAYPVQAATRLSGQAYGHPHCTMLLHDDSGLAGVLDWDGLRQQGLLEINYQA